jgi:NADH:ubiquinone reductase (non-electrogenic)
MKGAEDSIFAIGDCTSTAYAPTAQVASQQGAYLARQLHQKAKHDELESKLSKLEALAATVTGDEEKKAALREVEATKKQLAKIKTRPFEYSHQGSLAYIGCEKAIADLPFMNGNVCVCSMLVLIFHADFECLFQLATGGMATFLFWRSAYLSTLFSVRNRTLVATDWIKVKLFGRYVPSNNSPPIKKPTDFSCDCTVMSLVNELSQNPTFHYNSSAANFFFSLSHIDIKHAFFFRLLPLSLFLFDYRII